MGKIVYLDNCCFNRPYDNQSQTRISLEAEAKLKIQDMIKNNEVELVGSYILDYTKWHRNLFEGMSVEAFNDAAVDYVKSHPFEGKATIIE